MRPAPLCWILISTLLPAPQTAEIPLSPSPTLSRCLPVLPPLLSLPSPPPAGRRCASVRAGARAHCCCLPGAPLRGTLAPLLALLGLRPEASRPHIQTEDRARVSGRRAGSLYSPASGPKITGSEALWAAAPKGCGRDGVAEPVPFTLRRPSLPGPPAGPSVRPARRPRGLGRAAAAL